MSCNLSVAQQHCNGAQKSACCDMQPPTRSCGRDGSASRRRQARRRDGSRSAGGSRRTDSCFTAKGFSGNFGCKLREEGVGQLAGSGINHATAKLSELAADLATGARAVGGACRANPWVLLVPCHRIIAANGDGGFMGAAAGAWPRLKQYLLAHEQRCFAS